MKKTKGKGGSRKKETKPARTPAATVTRVHLNRAMSKLGILTRSQATEAILGGRVRVNGRVVTNPAHPVNPASARIEVDEPTGAAAPAAWRTLLLHKPRGVVAARRDPGGRPSVYDLLKGEGEGLLPVGAMDQGTSGLLLLTSDNGLAGWITDPRNPVARLYVVTTRGRVTEEEAAQLEAGITLHGERTSELRADRVMLRKASNRESHLTVQIGAGTQGQVRRLFEAIGHEVTRLKRVKVAGLELDALEPGQWREVSEREIAKAFPGFTAGEKAKSGRS